MSRETLEYHWGKHHRTYVENLNKQINGTELDGMSLEDIILVTYNNGNILPQFNNAAQVPIYFLLPSPKYIIYYMEAILYEFLCQLLNLGVVYDIFTGMES